MMNKLLMKLANDERLSKGVVLSGMALSIISNVIVYVGVYYTALHRGAEIRDEYYYQEEVKRYKENQNIGG